LESFNRHLVQRKAKIRLEIRNLTPSGNYLNKQQLLVSIQNALFVLLKSRASHLQAARFNNYQGEKVKIGNSR